MALLWQFYVLSIGKGVSIALQKTRGVLILKHVIIESDGSSRLNMLSGFPSFSFSNMVLATCGGFGT